MNNITIRNLQKEDASKIYNLELKYNKFFPDSMVLEGEFYAYHPAFDSGKNVFCLFDNNENLLAYCPLFIKSASPESSLDTPNTIWSEIMADPDIKNQYEIKDLLYNKMLERAKEIKQSLPDRELRLAFNYPASYHQNIDYLLSKGFMHNSDIYRMKRNLNTPILEFKCPENITIKKWKLETTDAKRNYINSYNKCFPQAPMTLEGIEFLFQSSIWENSIVISAVDKNDIILASVFAYFDKQSNDATGQDFGMTEEIFVLPEYRHCGIAKCIISQGLIYLKSCNLNRALLEVLYSNENALTLYKSLGYTIKSCDFILEKYI